MPLLRRRAMMLTKTKTEPINLVDLDAYGQCLNRFEANMGIATIGADGLVTMLDGAVAVYLNIVQDKQPEFYAV